MVGVIYSTINKDTGGTACKAAKLLKTKGAKEIYFGACHGLLSNNALDILTNGNFDKIILTNTVEINERFGNNDKVDILDVSEMCAAAIYYNFKGESISKIV